MIYEESNKDHKLDLLHSIINKQLDDGLFPKEEIEIRKSLINNNCLLQHSTIHSLSAHYKCGTLN